MRGGWPSGEWVGGRRAEGVYVGVGKGRAKVDPSGGGDGVGAGLLAAPEWGLSWARAAQVGRLLATLVLETVGTQEYQVKTAEFADRLAESYGDNCAAEVLPHLA